MGQTGGVDFPTSGTSTRDVLAELDKRRALEPDNHGGRLFGLVYPSADEGLERLLHEVYEKYLFGNALNPLRFPEVARLEQEVLGMVGGLLNLEVGGPFSGRGGGAMTSGGTESILMSMKVNRERARLRGIARPQIVAARTAHPAYAKAAHYFDMELVSVPVDDQWRAVPEAMAAAITENTAVVVASAFTYPHGVLDPVSDIAAIAAERGIGCHVDACIGAMSLPFWERLGEAIDPWDFRVPGVTEISADIHKYGFIPKGASVVLHRDADWFGHQVFTYDEWPSGLYASSGVAGAKPAAPIAAAWAALRYLGVEGYTALHGQVRDASRELQAGIASIDGLEIVGQPVGPVLAWRSTTHDIGAIGDAMEDRGWHVNRNTEPDSLHVMLSPAHAPLMGQFVDDLRASVAAGGQRRSTEVRYA